MPQVLEAEVMCRHAVYEGTGMGPLLLLVLLRLLDSGDVPWWGK